MNSDYRSFIEETEFYRGQIVYEWARPEIKGEKSFIFTDKSFNPYSAFTDYYTHQKDLVDKLHNGKNLLFTGPFNIGKTTIALLYSLDYIFNEHKSVLFVTPNSFEKELEKKLLNKILIESKLDWLVDVHDIKEEINNDKYIGLFPSINIIEAKDLHYFLLPNHSKYSSLFDTLGLMVYDDFEKFSGNLASNLHFINKRLKILFSFYNKDNSQLKYLILSKPFHESKGIVEGIFNEEFEIMHCDDKEINPAKVFYWIPAFDKVDIKYNPENKTLTRIAQRESFVDDTYILALESLKRGKNTTVYYSNIPFSKDDLTKRNRFINYIKRFGEIDEFTLKKFFIGFDWSDLTSQIIEKGMDWEQIDTLIIAMFSGSISDLRDYILHVCNLNAEIFITMPQTPSFQFEINHPSLEIIKDSKEIAKGENISIFAFSRGESLSQKHKTISAFEIKNIPDEYYREKYFEYWDKEKTNKEIFEQCESYCKNILDLEGYDIYSTEYENYFTLVNQEGKILGTVNSFELPDSYFLNAVMCRQNDRFKVSKIDLSAKKIELIQLGEFSLTISQRDWTKINENTIRSFDFASIKFIVKNKKVKAKFNNYKVSTGTDPHPASFQSASEENIELNDIQITGVEISGFSNAQAFANILNISLNTKISLYNLIPNYFTLNGSSFFYNLGGDDLRYLVNDANIKDLLERALTILIDCPCTDGCAGCLEDFKIDSSDFSKKELMEFLGRILKKENLDSIIRWKYEAIGKPETLREDMIKFKNVKEKVFEILERKANIVINNPYDEKFISDDDAKWIGAVGGLCHGKKKTVYIKPGCEEAIFTDICAHEYTHNWQGEDNLNSRFQLFDYNDIENESNIWFEGKLFLEGQANFFAAKVMDFFGLRDLIYKDEYSSYGQYREGLILLNYLEKKYGLLNLNSILKDGKLNGITITPGDIDLWYDESGIKGLVRGEADKLLKDNENLRCIQYEFLDKTLDLHRITYHINHRVFPQSPTLLEQLREAELNEDEAFPKIWEIIKNNFKIQPKKNFDYLPCKDCAYKKNETLNGLCMMFGSISVKDEIKKYLKIDS